MKKLLIIAILASFVSLGINAQEPIQYGVKAGVNLSSASVSADAINCSIGLGKRVGFQAGVFAEKKFLDIFGLQAGLDFSLDGTSISCDYDGAKGTYEGDISISTTSLSIPILAKYYANKNFSVFAGPYISYRTSLSVSFEADKDLETYLSGVFGGQPESVYNGIIENEAEDLLDENLRKINFGLILGVQYSLENNIFFEACYKTQLSNSIKDDLDTSSINGSADNMNWEEYYGTKPSSRKSSFQITVGYKF